MLKEVSEFVNKSDEELMLFYQSGSDRAFDIIYQRYGGRILGYLRKRTKSDGGAQDLMQEVFLKLHRSRSQYKANLPLAPWIFSVTRSVFLDSCKRVSKEESTTPEVLDAFESIAATSVNDRSELIELLEGPQRLAVSLRVFEEQAFEDIAKHLSTTPENARQVFSRGIRKLRSLVQGKE